MINVFRAAAVVALLVLLSSQGCASADTRQILSAPDSVAQKIDMGFSADVGIGATMGHSVPLEGEILNTPPCVAEARAGEDCK